MIKSEIQRRRKGYIHEPVKIIIIKTFTFGTMRNVLNIKKMRKLLIIALMIIGYAATGQHIRHNQLRPF